MLKHLKFSGIFHDDNLSVHLTLENPLDYDLDVATMVFSVTVRAKNDTDFAPKLEDFTFYIMDEAGCMYDTQHIPTPATTKAQESEESEYLPDGLIVTDFKHHFLYQDLRIAFCYRLYQRTSIIELNH